MPTLPVLRVSDDETPIAEPEPAPAEEAPAYDGALAPGQSAVAEQKADPAEADSLEPVVPADAPGVRPRRFVYALAILVLVAATGLGFAVGSYDRKNEPGELLADAFRRVRAADTAVRRVDEAVSAGLDVQPAAIQAAEQGLPAGRDELLTALDDLSRAQRGLKGRDLERGQALRKAAQGRLAMLRSAALLLPLQERGARAYDSAEAGWASVRRAGTLADDAAAAFNTHTEAGVASSTALTERAESELTSAEAALREAGRAMPEADLKPALGFVAGKRKSGQASRRIDAVWLKGDVEEANRLLAELAAADAPLDALLGSLPKSAGETIRAAYRELTADLTDDYVIGERLAGEGDEALRAVSAAQPSE